MPELPEVETIVNDLRKKIINQKINKIDIRLKKIIKNKPNIFYNTLLNKSFSQIIRRGKYIFFQINNSEKYLMVHLRMTGQLIYQKDDKIIAGGHSDQKNILNIPNKQTHLIIYFKNKSKLFYNDQRQFGIIKIIDKEEFNFLDEKQGIEPLNKNFTFKQFEKLIKNKKKNIKAFLLDQDQVTGIGNIYADETLFEAGINPHRNTKDLSSAEKKKIYLAIKKILKKAIKYRGTTFNDYRDTEGNQGNFFNRLKVYGRDGEKCLRCGDVILKTKLAGRGTRYCKKCQK
jgi:formamidopyrimidine-DNA glycosylase